MFKPVKVIDIETSRTIKTVNGLGRYHSIKGLVRFCRTPLGYIHLPVIDNKCEANTIIDVVIKKFSRSIIRKCLYNWLLLEQRLEISSVEDLLNTPDYVNSKKQFPFVSVAVCTRDRADYLSGCLERLSQLDYPELEILVIDNASTSDETKTLVRKYPEMRYIYEPDPGLNIARNRAVSEAKGEIIAFTDDDAIVDHDWLYNLVNIFAQSPKVMGVTGLVVPYELKTEPQLLFENYNGFGRGFKQQWCCVKNNNAHSVAIFHGGTGKFGCGANMSFRKTLFDKIGNFDPALDVGTPTNGGGDLEIFFRVLKEGHSLVYEPGAIVYHKHRKKYSQLRSQISNWGIASTSYLIRSATAYPDERFALTAQWFGRLLCRNLPRLFISLIAPKRLTRNLIVAELKGSFVGLSRYQASCAIVRKVDPGFNLHLYKPDRSILKKKKDNSKGTFNIDLKHPLSELKEAENYVESVFNIKFNDLPLGKIVIPNGYESIGIPRLSRAITDKFDIKLLNILLKKKYPAKANIKKAMRNF